MSQHSDVAIKTPSLPTGEWHGYFFYPDHSGPCWMRLYLTFRNDRMRGEGHDHVGAFTLDGEVDRHSGRCTWIKQYVGAHQVQYTGRCTSEGIHGQWAISGQWGGTFHIWHEGRPLTEARDEASLLATY